MKTLLFLLSLAASIAFADSVPINFPTSCTASGAPSGAVTISCAGPPPTCPAPQEVGTPPNCVCNTAGGWTGTPPNCVQTPPPVGCSINLTFPWQATTNKVVPMNPSDTIAIKFVPTPTSSTYSSITGGEWASPAANRTYSLSAVSCDFGPGVGKFPQTSSSVSVYFTVGKTNPYGFPVLTPGTPYYLNVKNAAPVSSGSHQMFFNVFP